MRNSPMQNAAHAAWNSFYKSGKAEDYIRYVQLTRRELADVDFTAEYYLTRRGVYSPAGLASWFVRCGARRPV